MCRLRSTTNDEQNREERMKRRTVVAEPDTTREELVLSHESLRRAPTLKTRSERSRGFVGFPLALGSLNKIPCHKFPCHPVGPPPIPCCSSPPVGVVSLSLSSLPFLVCWASVCITKRQKAESEAQRGKPKGTLESESRKAIL